jgi:hypothetical protein
VQHLPEGGQGKPCQIKTHKKLIINKLNSKKFVLIKNSTLSLQRQNWSTTQTTMKTNQYTSALDKRRNSIAFPCLNLDLYRNIARCSIQT